MINCRQCKKPFTPNPNARRKQLYCNTSCAGKYSRLHKTGKHPSKNKKKYITKICHGHYCRGEKTFKSDGRHYCKICLSYMDGKLDVNDVTTSNGKKYSRSEI